MDSNAAYRQLKRKFKKVEDYAMKVMKEEVAIQIQEHYDLFIKEFYDHYDPKFYLDRTFSTYEASDASKDWSIAYTRPNEDYVGIYVSADFIYGNPYYVPGKYGHRSNGNPVDKDWVFTNTFEKGIHGYGETRGGSVMKESPKVMMDKWYKNFKSNKGHALDKIRDEAYDRAFAKYKIE